MTFNQTLNVTCTLNRLFSPTHTPFLCLFLTNYEVKKFQARFSKFNIRSKEAVVFLRWSWTLAWLWSIIEMLSSDICVSSCWFFSHAILRWGFLPNVFISRENHNAVYLHFHLERNVRSFLSYAFFTPTTHFQHFLAENHGKPKSEPRFSINDRTSNQRQRSCLRSVSVHSICVNKIP